MFWVIQGLGLFVVLFTLLANLQKVKWKTMLFFAITNAFMIPVYILSGSLLGGLLVAGALLRTIEYMVFNLRNKRPDNLVLVLFGIYYLTISIIFFKNYIDIFMIANLVIITFTTWQNNFMFFEVGSIVSSCLLLPYDILLGAYTTAASEIIMLVFAIIYIVKNCPPNKPYKIAENYFHASKGFWAMNVENFDRFDMISSNIDNSSYYNFCLVKDYTNIQQTFSNMKAACAEKQQKCLAYTPYNAKKQKSFELLMANTLQVEFPTVFEDVWMKLIDGFNLNDTNCKLLNVTFSESQNGKEIADLYANGYLQKSSLSAQEKNQVLALKNMAYSNDEPVQIKPFVAYYNNSPISLVILLVTKNTAYVTKVCTLPKFRRKHVASALLQFAIDSQRKLGKCNFILVTDKNSTNEKFYKFNNFEECARAYALDITKKH